MPPARGSLGAFRDRVAVSFAEIFLAKVPPKFLHEQSTDVLAHVVLGAFRFLQCSRPGVVDVQVFDPSMELETRNDSE